MKGLLVVIILVLAGVFGMPGASADTGPGSASVDDDGLPRFPHKACELRTDTMCQVATAEEGLEIYRTIDDGLFCTWHLTAELADIYCARYWPYRNPVINAKLKKPTDNPPPWRTEA